LNEAIIAAMIAAAASVISNIVLSRKQAAEMDHKLEIRQAVTDTKLEELNTKQEKEKAFHDILYQVKKNAYEYYSGQLGSDVNALQKVIAGKKALEELGKTHISLD